MGASSDPYDELPYRSCPIDWTAPERLALTSLLHGGPRPPLDAYRVLELGCGNGANLLPLAYYRRQSVFLGVDGARSQIEAADARKAALNLMNIEFIHADFREAARRLSGQFDYILAHGVFSWVPDDVRDAVLDLVTRFLRPGGLVYLNYNARPGWDVRGLVRRFLLAQTGMETNLRSRAQSAKEVADRVAAALAGVAHPYSKLLANEFAFVGEGDISWIAHEYLAPHNQAYWRSEFLALARRYGLEYVADADFNYPSGRVPEELAPRLDFEKIIGDSLEDTVDLLCYRQLHSAILTPGRFDQKPPSMDEFADLFVASCLEPGSPERAGGVAIFRHPSGYEVEAQEDCMRRALETLQPLWPRGLRIGDLFPEVEQVADDLKLLQRNGLIELRCIEPGDFPVDSGRLNNLERGWGGYCTTPYHTTSTIAPDCDRPNDGQ